MTTANSNIYSKRIRYLHQACFYKNLKLPPFHRKVMSYPKQTTLFTADYRRWAKAGRGESRRHRDSVNRWNMRGTTATDAKTLRHDGRTEAPRFFQIRVLGRKVRDVEWEAGNREHAFYIADSHFQRSESKPISRLVPRESIHHISSAKLLVRECIVEFWPRGVFFQSAIDGCSLTNGM